MRRVAFLIGDFLFLVVASATAGWMMQAAHGTIGAFVWAAAGGMTAGMVATSAISIALRPLLGSIETAIPAMLGGMLGGTAVCLWMAIAHLDAAAALVAGAGAGVIVFVHFRWLDHRTARRVAVCHRGSRE